MTDYADYEVILAVLETGLLKARENPRPGEPLPDDNYVAFVVLQELRRAGWDIRRSPEAR